MRLLLINYEFPPLGGGAGNATAHLAREFAALGHTVWVMTARFQDLPPRQDLDGYTVIRIPARRQAADRSNPLEMLSFLLNSLWQVIRLSGELQPDYTIAFFGIPSAPAAWLLKVWRGVPYIVSLRGGDVPGFQPYDLKNFHRLTRPLIHFLWWQAAYVVANSQGLALLANATAPHRKIPVIPNGVDTQAFRPALDSTGVKVLFAGRLRFQKGLTYLVEAVALLPQDLRQTLQITLVGDGPLRDHLMQLADEKQVGGCFTWAGWVNKGEILGYYQSHSLFILPSLDEGMSNVLLEAMACGLPIIATRIAGSEELVVDNGWLVPPSDAQALADAIQEACQNPSRLALMGQISRQKAERLSWRSVAEQYLKLMQG